MTITFTAPPTLPSLSDPANFNDRALGLFGWLTGTFIPELEGVEGLVPDGGDFNVDAGTFFVDVSTNRVGIGTSSPLRLLHLQDGSVDGDARIRMQNDAQVFDIGLVGSAADSFIIRDNTAATDVVRIDTGSPANSLRVTSSGVGIGTTTPSEKLHVNGNVLAAGNINISKSAPALNIRDTGGTSGFQSVYFVNDSDIFSVQTRNDSGVFIATDYAINRDVNGASAHRFSTQGSERMRISSSGYVGIGTSSPSEQLSATANISATNFYVTGGGDTSTNGISGEFAHGDINSKSLVIRADPNNAGGGTAMRFEVDGSEAARFDSSGNLLVAQSSTTFPGSGNTTTGHAIRDYGEVFHSVSSGTVLNLNRNTSDGPIAAFRREGLFIGRISITTSAVSYNTTSDERLKENIADAGDAGDMIDAIRMRQYDWKADGRHQRWGVVAQEVVDVFPEAITKGDTEDDMWGVDYSKFVPALIKEIQTLRGRVAMLEAA